MKKLIFSLGLLVCGGNMAYGMDTAYNSKNIMDITTDEIIVKRDWTVLVKKLQHPYNETNLAADFALLSKDTTPASILNQPSPIGLYLLPTLIYNGDNKVLHPCNQALVSLLKNNKLDLTAIDEHGKLLCNDDILDDTHKERLLELLTTNNIPNPFTHTNDPTLGMTFHLKRSPILSARTIQHYKLWFCGAVIAIAAVGIYKWRKAKADKTDAAGNEQDQAQEKHGTKQVITEK